MELPTLDTLKDLRKGLRKKRLPHVFDGMWCSEPGIGGVKLTADGSDFQVVWVVFENGVLSEPKQSSWRSLCCDPTLEMQRLEIGLIASEIMHVHGQRVEDSIGHPIEAHRQAKPYRDTAARWKHWALVKAGHMLGL
jgi:hypothetical protein